MAASGAGGWTGGGESAVVKSPWVVVAMVTCLAPLEIASLAVCERKQLLIFDVIPWWRARDWKMFSKSQLRRWDNAELTRGLEQCGCNFVQIEGLSLLVVMIKDEWWNTELEC